MPFICSAWAFISSDELADSSALAAFLLGDLVHVRNGLIHLIDPLGLLSGGGGDLSHQLGHLHGALLDPAELIIGPFHQLGAVPDPFGWCPRSGWRCSWPPRPHAWPGFEPRRPPTAKPAPASPGPGRLHRGIQGQEVGLKGDLVDRLDDLGGLLTGRGDLPAWRRSSRSWRHWPTSRSAWPPP